MDTLNSVGSMEVMSAMSSKKLSITVSDERIWNFLWNTFKSHETWAERLTRAAQAEVKFNIIKDTLTPKQIALLEKLHEDLLVEVPAH